MKKAFLFIGLLVSAQILGAVESVANDDRDPSVVPENSWWVGKHLIVFVLTHS